LDIVLEKVLKKNKKTFLKVLTRFELYANINYKLIKKQTIIIGIMCCVWNGKQLEFIVAITQPAKKYELVELFELL